MLPSVNLYVGSFSTASIEKLPREDLGVDSCTVFNGTSDIRCVCVINAWSCKGPSRFLCGFPPRLFGSLDEPWRLE